MPDMKSISYTGPGPICHLPSMTLAEVVRIMHQGEEVNIHDDNSQAGDLVVYGKIIGITVEEGKGFRVEIATDPRKCGFSRIKFAAEPLRLC